MSVHATVRNLKQNDEDFEWYPTTDEIIQQVADDLVAVRDEDHWSVKIERILDIGAGDGRVLVALRDSFHKRDKYHVPECYAIEKAITHLSNMPKDITVIGTDFEQQVLVDKYVCVIFCNPPYSEYEQWVLKILREASAKWIYLVIPRRWRDSGEIRIALENRQCEVHSLGEFDFEDADRRASAKVEVVRIAFSYRHREAFDSVLEEMLPELDVFNVEIPSDENLNRDLFKADENLVERLAAEYDRDLANMLENYKAALRISPGVLKELGISRDGVLKSIRMKIQGLKNRYWRTLFEEMSTVTERLATKQRKAFLDSLESKVKIDFTANNVYSILIWVSKWANDYFDEQLIDLFRTLSTDSCVIRYKSNDRVWTKGNWRYFRDDSERPTHYRLEYRIVLSHGGISNSSYEFQRNEGCGLVSSSFNMLRDICTVANNLGFPCKDNPRNYTWVSNKQNILRLNNGEPLVAVRAFKNGNMHLHFNTKVMLAINVEAGRLLRWIRNPAEACEEFQATGDEAKQIEKLFNSSFRIGTDAGMLKLTHEKPAEEVVQMTQEEIDAFIAESIDL